MSDWGPVFIAVILFILFSPGLLFQLPGRNKFIEFGNFQTSGISIVVHALLYFAFIAIFLLAIGVHINRNYNRLAMADWAPVVIGVVLFILLQPGLIFTLPGNHRHIELGSLKTNGKAITVHSLIFFAIFTILILAVKIHIYTG
ncbi:uncharacterized protein [Aristolochia californica]|uniref:uncharacterized protein n=1 Tax=Aristolochia californica TaxID=171875 RepID=UPI0035E1AA18